jgi:hypothetical protein
MVCRRENGISLVERNISLVVLGPFGGRCVMVPIMAVAMANRPTGIPRWRTSWGAMALRSQQSSGMCILANAVITTLDALISKLRASSDN